jgi:hypothetical protein
MLAQPQGVLISLGGPFRSPALRSFGLQVCVVRAHVFQQAASVPVLAGSAGGGPQAVQRLL